MKRPVVITLLIVALVLVCAGIGSVIFFALNSGLPGRFFEANLVSASAEESKTIKVDAESPVTLEVIDDAGNVTVLGADVDTIQVKVVKTAYAPTQERAEEELKTIKYAIEQTGNTVTIRYETPNIYGSPQNITVIDANQETVDFIITVPTETKAEVTTGLGEVNVSGLHGQVSIDNDFGDITVEKVNGELSATTQSGRVTATSVNAGGREVTLESGFGNLSLEKVTAGDLRIESESGVIELTDVRASGDVELYTKFGDITFEKGSADKLTITTESGKVELTSIKASGALNVTDTFGNIVLEKVDASSYEIETESGAVEVDGASGPVRAHSGFGNINIQNGNNATIDLNTESGTVTYEGSLGEGPHKLHSSFGGIKLVIPADSALNIDLKTEFGKIKSDLPITITVSGDVEANHFVGTINDGGSSLTATTQSGEITLEILSQ